MRRLRVSFLGLSALSVLVSALPNTAMAFKIVSFDGKFTRWKTNTIHYQLDSKGSADFPGGCDKAGACVTLDETFKKSFDSWTAVNGVQLTFIQDSSVSIKETGYDSKNQIVFVETGWKSLSFAPPSGALAVTISTYKVSSGEIVDSDIHFNGENFSWADINTDEEEKSGQFVDVQNIATHEIGHFIGMDHASEDIFEPDPKLYLATMFFASGPGEIFRRQLNDDDRGAAQTLYPQSEMSAPIVDSVTPNQIDTMSTPTATLRIVGRGFLSNTAAVLAMNNGNGDVAAKILTVSDTEITASIPVNSLPSGQYDLVVANAFDQITRASGAVTLNGAYSGYASDGSGSGYGPSTGGGCAVNGNSADDWSGVLLLLFPVLLLATLRLKVSAASRRRAQLVPVKANEDSRITSRSGRR